MAEWAQLLSDVAGVDGLEPGRWYGVIDRLNQGMVKLSGPNATPVMVSAERLYMIDHEPDTVTRITKINRAKAGKSENEVTTEGVCPKGHHISNLELGDTEAACPDCEVTYSVEDQHSRWTV